METRKQTSRFTILHRILHWTMGLAMSILFITGFLRMYWMNKHRIISVIKSRLSDASLSDEQMTSIATDIRAPMWQWHEVFAHVMIIAFIIRMIYMMVRGTRFPSPLKAIHSVKDRFKGLTYILFYLLVGVNIITGIYLKWSETGMWKSPAETIHKLALYWFPVIILIHFTGIIVGELTNEKGVTSKMIGGG